MSSDGNIVGIAPNRIFESVVARGDAATQFAHAEINALASDSLAPHSLMPVVLVITGPPASGKSTLGRELVRRLRVPLLAKDLFKEVLFDRLGWSDLEWSHRLGAASMALLYRSAAALIAAGQSVALEANFYAEWDTRELRALAEQHPCRFVQIVCTASAATLEERYRRRITSGERHPGHTESEPLEETLRRLRDGHWGALDLEGPVITVDTERDLSPEMLDSIENEIRQAISEF